jgi:hypothetical protein
VTLLGGSTQTISYQPVRTLPNVGGTIPTATWVVTSIQSSNGLPVGSQAARTSTTSYSYQQRHDALSVPDSRANSRRSSERVRNGGDGCDERCRSGALHRNRIRSRQPVRGQCPDIIGATKNTSIFLVPLENGSVVNTVPDATSSALFGGANVDVKDVANLTFTRQLRGEQALSLQQGVPWNIITSPNNRTISGPLWNGVLSTIEAEE